MTVMKVQYKFILASTLRAAISSNAVALSSPAEDVTRVAGQLKRIGSNGLFGLGASSAKRLLVVSVLRRSSRAGGPHLYEHPFLELSGRRREQRARRP